MRRPAALAASWRHFNEAYFGGKLKRPRTLRLVRSVKYEAKLHYRAAWRSDDSVRIFVSRELPLRRRQGALLHEMLHQYQIQVLGIEPCHDRLFRSFARYLSTRSGFQVATVLGEPPAHEDW